MLLLDIGNTNIKVFEKGEIKRFDLKSFSFPKEKFYYICVNEDFKKKIEKLPNSVNLEGKFSLKTKYRGLGVDRAVACHGVFEGVVVDAGSAITVDLMIDHEHQGGFIMPGLSSYKESFANISSKLICNLDEEITLDRLPLKTTEALTYGVIKPIVCVIKEWAKDKKIYLTGGDAKALFKFFENCVYDEKLVFKGMQKVIKEIEC